MQNIQARLTEHETKAFRSVLPQLVEDTLGEAFELHKYLQVLSSHGHFEEFYLDISLSEYA